MSNQTERVDKIYEELKAKYGGQFQDLEERTDLLALAIQIDANNLQREAFEAEREDSIMDRKAGEMLNQIIAISKEWGEFMEYYEKQNVVKVTGNFDNRIRTLDSLIPKEV